jgi:hypothetical protein
MTQNNSCLLIFPFLTGHLIAQIINESLFEMRVKESVHDIFQVTIPAFSCKAGKITKLYF